MSSRGMFLAICGASELAKKIGYVMSYLSAQTHVEFNRFKNLLVLEGDVDGGVERNTYQDIASTLEEVSKKVVVGGGLSTVIAGSDKRFVNLSVQGVKELLGNHHEQDLEQLKKDIAKHCKKGDIETIISTFSDAEVYYDVLVNDRFFKESYSEADRKNVMAGLNSEREENKRIKCFFEGIVREIE